MKLIKLTQDKYAIVDDEDFEKVNKHNWSAAKQKGSNNYYASCAVWVEGKRTRALLHRFILNAQKGTIIDHANRDTLDCRKNNLRVCNNSQNGANRNPSTKGTSKYLGVSWDNRKRKWRAQITINKRTNTLGRFNDEISAAIAYDKAAKDLHKEFANCNFK